MNHNYGNIRANHAVTFSGGNYWGDNKNYFKLGNRHIFLGLIPANIKDLERINAVPDQHIHIFIYDQKHLYMLHGEFVNWKYAPALRWVFMNTPRNKIIIHIPYIVRSLRGPVEDAIKNCMEYHQQHGNVARFKCFVERKGPVFELDHYLCSGYYPLVISYTMYGVEVYNFIKSEKYSPHCIIESQRMEEHH